MRTKFIFAAFSFFLLFIVSLFIRTPHISAATPGLVAEYGFGEGSGSTVADTSGTNNHGTISGAIWNATGKYGPAISFDGVNDLVSVPDSTSLDLTGGMTLEAWVKPTTLNGWKSIILKERPGNLAYALYANNSSNRPLGEISKSNGSSIDVAGTSKLAVGTWTYLAFTYNGSQIRLYVNGIQVSSKSTTGNIFVSGSPLSLGGNNVWNDEFYNGLIDEVRVYNRALTQAEIQTDMNTPIAPDTQAPTVSITAPAEGTTIENTTSVNATASDNVAVSGVQFKLDGANLGAEDTISPYSINWDTTTATNASHTLTAVARDNNGNQATSAPINVTVNNPPDTTPPTVNISSPADNATVVNSVTVSANASDNVSVAGVQFKLDGNNLGAQDTSSPFSTSWDTSAAGNGAHTLSAVARDAAGNQTTSAAVNVTVNNTYTPRSITVDGATTFQKMDSFGVNANPKHWNNGNLRPAIDMLVDDMGAKIWRVDFFGKMNWEAANDDSDPNNFNWNYYNAIYEGPEFQELWATVTYLNQKGAQVMLSASGETPSWMGGTTIPANMEDEWVETIASVAYYARNVKNLQFSMLSPINEENLGSPEGPLVNENQYASLMHKLAVKLDSIGMSDIKLIPPDSSNVATSYLPALFADSLVMSKIDHFAFHNYFGFSGDADSVIKSSAYPNRNFWMTEWSQSVTDPQVDQGIPPADEWVFAQKMTDFLFNHIRDGAAGALAWDAWDNVHDHYDNGVVTKWGLLAWDQTNDTYSPKKRFYTNKQIFKLLPIGSTRIATTASNSDIEVFSFFDHATGKLAIIGQNFATTPFTINATLSNIASLNTLTTVDLYQTNRTQDFAFGGSTPVSNGSFSLNVAASGFFTIVGQTVIDQIPPTANITSPIDGSAVSGTITVSANAADNVSVVGVQFKLDGLNLGLEDTTAPYEITWDTTTVANGSHTLTATAKDSAGNQTTSTSVLTSVNNLLDTEAPTVAITGPAEGATVSGTVNVDAAAADNVSVVGVQFKLDGLNLGSEDTTAPYSFSWTTNTTTNGNHILTAVARDGANNQTTSTGVNVNVSNLLPASLVAGYSFNEGSGTTISDLSPNGNSGTISGAAWSTGGKYGNALSFDGVNDWVTIADSNSLDLAGGMTIEAWVKPTTLAAAWKTIILKERPGHLAYALYGNTGGNIPSAEITTSTNYDTLGTSVIPTGTWTHLASTYDGATLKLFVNGNQVSTRAATDNIFQSANPLRFGGNSVWTEFFNGLIDEVRIYNQARTQAEIQTDMNTPL